MENLTTAAVVAPMEETDETSVPDYSGDYYDLPEEASMTVFTTVVLPIIYTIVCVIGLFGNALVIYIMYLKKRNLSVTDIYVVNLAIADFIFVATLPFWTSDVALGRWVFGPLMCKIISGLTYFHMYAGMFFVTAMSIDRFLAVVLYQKKIRTKNCAVCAAVTLWLIAAILGAVPSYFRGVDEETAVPKCAWTFEINSTSHNAWFMAYVVSRSFIGFVIPLLVIIVCYSSIIIFLKTRKASGKLTRKSQDKATKMVMVVIAVFLVCWVPNQVSNMIYVAESLEIIALTEQQQVVHFYVHMFSTCLAWMHSCANPILYAFMREDMRLKMAEIVNHNVKRCCGDKTWLNREQSDGNLRLSQRQKTEEGRNSGSDDRTRYTSIRLSNVHKQSVEEDLLIRDQSCERKDSQKENKRQESSVEDDVFHANSQDGRVNYSETAQQGVALLSDNGITAEVQKCNENEML